MKRKSVLSIRRGLLMVACKFAVERTSNKFFFQRSVLTSSVTRIPVKAEDT